MLSGTPQGPSWELGEPKKAMMKEYNEHIGKKEENFKIAPPTPPPKGKNKVHPKCMLGLPINYMKILFFKLIITIFSWAHSPHIFLVYLLGQTLQSLIYFILRKYEIRLKHFKCRIINIIFFHGFCFFLFLFICEKCILLASI